MNLNSDKEYYNDLPGKLPPDMLHEDELQKRSQRNVVKVVRLSFVYSFRLNTKN